MRILLSCLLLTPFLLACDFSLGLDIMNAGDKEIEVAVGSQSQHVVPGLGFHGRFPRRGEHASILITEGLCRYRYQPPDLDLEPWQSLIGNSIKFRWFSDGRMVAFPPTPDVGLPFNPQRASVDDTTRTIRPKDFSCH